MFRVYVLYLIGSRLMPTSSGNLVHLSFLQLLDKSPVEVGQYSWGSTCLAMLYRSLCGGAIYGTGDMSGCTILLQNFDDFDKPHGYTELRLVLTHDVGFTFGLYDDAYLSTSL